MDTKDHAHSTTKTSVLAADLIVTGIIATEGALEVNGSVDGEVAADTLIIGETGVVTGKVRANRADIHGQLKGELTCTDLMLRSTADLDADTSCEMLTVETGAQVQGRFKRPSPQPKATATTTSSAAANAAAAETAKVGADKPPVVPTLQMASSGRPQAR